MVTRFSGYALLVGASLFLFLAIMRWVIGHELITAGDAWIQAKMALLRGPGLDATMIFITTIASPKILVILTAILLAFFAWKKRWHHFLLLFSSMGGGLFLVSLAKIIMHRARPENALVAASGYSFPSGHAALAIIFVSVLLYFGKKSISNTFLKCLLVVAAAIFSLMVAFSRLYLQVHWLSDVVGGFALGLFWLLLVVLMERNIGKEYWRKIFKKNI